MFKKKYLLFVLLTLFFVIIIFYGSLLRHHYIGGQKFINLQKIVVFIAEIPKNFKIILRNKSINTDFIEPISTKPFLDKKFFEKKISTIREELILVSRFDGNIGRAIVEIRDMNTFEVLHSYLPNVDEIYSKIDFSRIQFKKFQKERHVNRFPIVHPAITSKGEIIFTSLYPIVKIDFNGKVMWVNDKNKFHHSINFDVDENIYTASNIFPFSKKIEKFMLKNDKGINYDLFEDHAVNIIDQKGNILFTKSVAEIFIENGLTHKIFSGNEWRTNPFHMNDVEPVLKDGPYFKKGDLFLSLRNLSMVILYRPKNNKIIKIIEGAFFNQHDVDILNDEEISIYNNNNVLWSHRQKIASINEVIIYNFKTNKFSKKFEKAFKSLKINSTTNSLLDFLDDGSVIIEDWHNGRILYLDSNGEVIWEFNNLSDKKLLYKLWWSRIINVDRANEIRKIINNKK